MAKSIRSKWKRKMRNKKRQKNAPRELARLKTCLALDATDVEMKELVTVTDVKKIKQDQEAKTDSSSAPDKMEVDGDTSKVKKRKSLRDENGQYPAWMNQRAIQKISRHSKRRKHGKAKSKRSGKKR